MILTTVFRFFFHSALTYNFGFNVINVAKLIDDDRSCRKLKKQSETWGDLLDDPTLNHVQSYVSLKVRMVFDPPEVGHTSSAFQRHLDELTWRITNTTDLGTPDYEEGEEPVILDGGSP